MGPKELWLRRFFFHLYWPCASSTLKKSRLSQGLSQGRLLALQEDVIEGLSVRFSHVPDELREAITAISEESRLRAMHNAALRADTVEDFTASL